MSKTTTNIIEIIKTGIDIEVSVASKTTTNIIKIIEALAPNQKLTIIDTYNITTTNLVKIANTAKKINRQVKIVIDTQPKQSL